MSLILLVLIILLLAGGSGYWGVGAYGPAYGGGISLGTVLVILLIAYLLGFFR